jgi:hypothetical protein
MSKSAKAATVIVIALIVVAGIWWWSANTNRTAAPGVTENANTASNVTDAALNQDLASIDLQMNGLASDSASADQGLSDQPITQSQL